jgi:DNA-binding transcriptional LysR family regulator
MSNIWHVPWSEALDMTMDIELRHLRYFIAVAEEEGFSQAARRLSMAQPPLSQQIRQLEERIGVALFERRPRVKLTPAGERLLPAARHQLALLERSMEAARRASSEPRGVLQVGFSSSAALTVLPKVWQAFRARTPEVELRLQELHSAEQLERLRTGVLDVAILREPTVDDAFSVRELIREPLVAVLPARHRLARSAAVRVAALSREPLVLFPRPTAPTLYDQIMSVCAEGGFAPVIGAEAREWHTITALVAAGFGVAIAPAGVARLRLPGAVTRPLRPSLRRAALFLCYAHATVSRSVAAFIEFMATSPALAGALDGQRSKA